MYVCVCVRERERVCVFVTVCVRVCHDACEYHIIYTYVLHYVRRFPRALETVSEHIWRVLRRCQSLLCYCGALNFLWQMKRTVKWNPTTITCLPANPKTESFFMSNIDLTDFTFGEKERELKRIRKSGKWFGTIFYLSNNPVC